MPSTWSSLTPFLSIKRAFSSHRSKKGRKRSPSPPPPTSPHQIAILPPSSSQSITRFSRRDEQFRTRKYLDHPSLPSPSHPISPPTVPRRTQSPSPLATRKVITPTQKWPSASTLLEWMEPCLEKRREEGKRMRTLSEGNLTPSRSSFYSSDSIPLPTKVTREMDGRRRGTTERVEAWIRNKSRSQREDQEEAWKRTKSARLMNRIPAASLRSRSIDNLSYSMPAAAGCTNCMTKYSLLNREVGCSGCALSFCKKCVQWKAVIPALSPNPVTVCRSCFDRIENEKKKKEERNSYSHTVTSTPLYPSIPQSSHSSQPTSYFASRSDPPTHYSQALPPSSQSHHSSIYPPSSSSSNLPRPWWNENDLPPPSMRSEYGRGVVQPRPIAKGMPPPSTPAHYSSSSQPPSASLPPSYELSEMEERSKKLRDEANVAPPSLSSLEERLAALRGIDVELVRNPRKYFESKDDAPRGDTVENLIEEARSRAILEEKNDPVRLLEERAIRLKMHKEEKEPDEGGGKNEVGSVSSRMSEMSEATKAELADIEKVMAEAKKRVDETEGIVNREKKEDDRKRGDVTQEMGEANRLAAQLSIDVSKVNDELAAFWQKENGKRSKDVESSDEELDDETLMNIVREAELAPDEPIAEKKTINMAEGTPEKKKGMFGKLFKK